MKRVYISGPITRGDLTHNIRQADHAMLKLMQEGYAPLNPMLSCFAGGVTRLGTQVYATGDAGANGGFRDLPHFAWVQADLAWVGVADAVLRLPGESSGAELECLHAATLGVPVFDSMDSLLAHFNDLNGDRK